MNLKIINYVGNILLKTNKYLKYIEKNIEKKIKKEINDFSLHLEKETFLCYNMNIKEIKCSK